MSHRYEAEIGELSKKLAKAMLDKEGGRLIEDPTHVDWEILQLLREVGNRTAGEVLEELASRVSEREKKADR